MENSTETHVSEAKKEKVKYLAEQMKKKTVMIVSIKGLPSAQFQEIKKKLRDRAQIQVVKKSLVNFALDHSGIKELHDLVPFVEDSTAILFSDSDAFEISGVLANEKSPAKAKAGQIAPMDIEVKAGPTELIPGPDISALSAVGLIPKVENGKISVGMDKVIAKEGAVITEALASIMAKLDIIPFEIGLEPVAAFMDGKVYADIKIDVDLAVEELENAFGRAIPFSVEIGYVVPETLDYILGKAKAYEGVITRVVTGEPEPVAEVVVEAKEEVKEETKPEKKEESAAGLSSLFG
ncbi:50S ribosomal protein L10 [archaeon]|jgi:large subunit ribosomal protein L10|nr:50S ribosomal protein L10 [archaeon]MBT6182737.1 50S ribosomal protein L10 [archaeon]MBT6606151.1 50S ribosomal protein L10 [archaeon]MBT7252009.1 50S ribosomal protein L10 [archaeon]MBT7660925.1 50S ribosomal protein L10 [archaeon]